MNNELSLYRVWRKLCKKIINFNFEEKKKKEEEILHEICHENKNLISAIKSFYIKNNARKITKR